MAPDGNYKSEAQFLQAKADNFARCLIISNLNKMETFIFHRSTYVPAMTYSSCVITLDTDTLNKIQRKAIAAILEKLGLNRNFPRRVAFVLLLAQKNCVVLVFLTSVSSKAFVKYATSLIISLLRIPLGT